MRSLPKRILQFLAHQLISTYGVIIGTAAGTYEGVFLVNVFHPSSRLIEPGSLLTEVPGFPLQTAAGLLMGFLLAKKHPHNAMLWVWVIPWLVLLIAAATLPIPTPGLLSYFFWHGCLIVKACFSQVAITLPVLTSTAYVAGTILARSLGHTGQSRPQSDLDK